MSRCLDCSFPKPVFGLANASLLFICLLSVTLSYGKEPDRNQSGSKDFTRPIQRDSPKIAAPKSAGFKWSTTASFKPSPRPVTTRPTAQVSEREKIQNLKTATVFIQTPTGTGTGFVCRFPGKGTFIVTNYHVISERQEDFLLGESSRPYAQVDVVFFSGTSRSHQTRANLFATFVSGDLALLSLDRIPKEVVPLTFDYENEPYETLPILVAGFPFGRELSGRNYPSPTIAKANVSSLRYNHTGALELVQLDTNLNPGNSGGTRH